MSWRTQDNYSIGGFCLKLKLTDSPGIAGGFLLDSPTKSRQTSRELLQIVRTAQKGLYVGKYEVLSGEVSRKRRLSGF